EILNLSSEFPHLRCELRQHQSTHLLLPRLGLDLRHAPDLVQNVALVGFVLNHEPSRTALDHGDGERLAGDVETEGLSDLTQTVVLPRRHVQSDQAEIQSEGVGQNDLLDSAQSLLDGRGLGELDLYWDV